MWNYTQVRIFRPVFTALVHKHVLRAKIYAREDLLILESTAGIVSENAKEPMVPGVGIAPNYTISRAILSDAVTLVRGDRFYTTDYNARNLTNWGYSEVQYDLNVNQGCVMYRLFLRAFPNHFKHNSIYAHYPMTIPSENKKILRDLGREEHYSWDKPALIHSRVDLTSYLGAKYILERPQEFKVAWAEGNGHIIGKGRWDSMLGEESPSHDKQKQLMGKSPPQNQWHQQIKDFYEHITLKLLHQHSCKLARLNQVDITRE